MIKQFWNSSRNGIRLLIDNVAAETGILHQVIDLGTVYNRDHLAAIELEILTGATAPGATKNLNLNYAFSSEDTKLPAELATCATTTACTLANLPNVRRVYESAVLHNAAQYLHVWFDHDALNQWATLDCILKINAEVT